MRPQPNPSSGFTIMEALISLVVVSLMLSLLLPIVGSGLTRNQSLGLAGLESMQTRLGEQLFRELVSGAARKPVVRLSDQFDPNLAGELTRARLRIEVDRRLPCALEGTTSEIELLIVQDAEGGELRCAGAPGGMRLLAWKNGQGEFAYSADGQSWLPDWPPTRRAAASGVESDKTEHQTPLIRFSVSDGDVPGITWIVSAGTPETPRYRFEFDSTDDAEAPF